MPRIIIGTGRAAETGGSATGSYLYLSHCFDVDNQLTEKSLFVVFLD